jgi:polysaccharide export outer membrane protein
MRLLTLAAVLVAAASCRAADLNLGPGDVLDIAVWNYKDLSMTATVTPDGTISYPLIGRLAVAGRTLEEVRSELLAAVARQIRDPKLAVNLVESGRRISILGEVRSPGQFALANASRLSEAMAMAGGVTATAWLQRVSLIRADGRIQVVDLSSILDGSNLANNVDLGPGDLILVPKLQLRVAVLGQVGSPGSYDMTRPNSTAIDAVSAAGGIAKGARPEAAVVVRRENGTQTVIRVDLRRATLGSADPSVPALRDGDIIYVPESHRLDWDKGFQAIIGITSIGNLLFR